MLNNTSGAKVAAIDSEKVPAFHLVTSGMGNSTKRRAKRRSLKSENEPDLPRTRRSDQKESDQCEDSLRVVKVVLGRGLSQSSRWRWEVAVWPL